jgi:hypothetical protein
MDEGKKEVASSELVNKSKKKGSSLLNFFRLGEVGGYFFRSKDPSRPSNINLKMMHGVNKISIAIFLLAVIYLILKRIL